MSGLYPELAMKLRSLTTRLQLRWQESVPHCGEPGCTLGRRLWRHIHWWNGTITLHGRRYCSPQCFEAAVRDRLVRVGTQDFVPRSAEHRIPLGLLMLSRGQLTNQQLRSALEAQEKNGQLRLGEWLEKLGFATEHQITAALGLQWACPVLQPDARRDPTCSRLLPFRLLENYRLLPLQYVAPTNTFYLAFCDGIDYTVLHAVEQMLQCHTDACLVTRTALDRALEQISRRRSPEDLLFEGWRRAHEMARIVCGYALKVGADTTRIVPCGMYVWVRLGCGRRFVNLLFRRPVPERESVAGSDEFYLPVVS